MRLILKKLSERFTEELEKKTSSINNKAIDAYFLCRCEYCTDVQTFLRDPEQTEYSIAIAEMHRNHILDETRHVTTLVDNSIDKSKRPYSLILKKSIIRLQSYKSKRFEKISKMHALLNNWITTIDSK